MKRWLPVVVIAIATLFLAGCGSGPSATSTPAVPPTAALPPTATPQQNQILPIGTLLLIQSEQSRTIAQTPDQKVIRIDDDDRLGRQGSPDGHYGVRYQSDSGAISLTLVDYGANPPALKAIPNGTGFTGPAVTWRTDSAGFAFFNIPTTGSSAPGTIYYYDVAGGNTRTLIPPSTQGTIAASVSFSPDGKYLLYSLSNADSEAIGGPDSNPFILDTTSGQSTALAAGTLNGFDQWLLDSSGFIALQTNAASKQRGVYLYKLNALGAPVRLSPVDQEDLIVSLSRDGKFIAVTSNGTGQITNIYTMNLETKNRRQITQFTDKDQTITQLVWGNDGIYFSLTNANQTSTWRMGPDGSSRTQVAQGTLQGIIGIGY